jgi:hypothetical protein
MRTTVLQGTEEEFNNLYQGVFDEDKVPQEVEPRVYIIDTSYAIPIADEDFMTLAEKLGRVYTLPGFQKAFNKEEINTSTDIIRIINVKI